VATPERRPLTPEEREDAQRLRALFEKQKAETGLTQEELAALGGWSGQSGASGYLNARIPLNLKAATAFARALGVSVRDISPRLAAKAADFFEAAGGEQTPRRRSQSAVMTALNDWRLRASSRSVAVIDMLTTLAKKNELREEDWQLIEDLAARLHKRS